MQNDLISRSELIKRIKTFTNISDSYYQNTDMLLAEIYNMPTAYSVEKVVDRLTERERNFDNTGIAMESLTSDGRANLSDFADKALTKLADYEDAEEQGLLVKIECHCKDCVYWSDMVEGATEHVKLCTVGGYMVGKNGYCVRSWQR